MARRQFQDAFPNVLEGSVTVANQASIADGDEVAVDITVTGAALGDFVLVSASVDVVDGVVNAQVTAADTVTVVMANNTGVAIDLAAVTYYVVVLKRRSS
jgi:hypothetical protein